MVRSAGEKTSSRWDEYCEMMMLRWMSSKTRKYRIRNEEIRDNQGVALIKDKIKINRLK